MGEKKKERFTQEILIKIPAEVDAKLQKAGKSNLTELLTEGMKDHPEILSVEEITTKTLRDRPVIMQHKSACGASLSVLKASSETEEEKENDPGSSEQKGELSKSNEATQDLDNTASQLSSIDLSNNLRKMFNSTPKRHLGARPRNLKKQ